MLSANLLISFNSTSIIKCSPNNPGTGHNCIRNDYGDQYFIESNSSNNNVHSYSSCLGVVVPNFFLCKYSSIHKNKATLSTIFQLNGGNNLKSINKTNIISNETPSGAVFQVFSGTYYINECIIFNNSKVLFSGTNIVSKCFIQHNLDYIGILLSTDNSFLLTLTYNLKHFSTYFCLNNYFFQSKKVNNKFYLNILSLIFPFLE